MMKINNIQLYNYHGFKSVTIDFNPKVTCLAGINGAGKSSVLNAIALCLSWIIARIKNPKGQGWFANAYEDACYGEMYGGITGKFSFLDKEIFVKQGFAANGVVGDIKSDYSTLNSLFDYVSTSSIAYNIPTLVYYPINRAVLDIPLRIRMRHDFNQFSVYENALDSSARFRDFFEWYRDREDIEYEERNNRHFRGKQSGGLQLAADSCIHVCVARRKLCEDPEGRDAVYTFGLFRRVKSNSNYMKKVLFACALALAALVSCNKGDKDPRLVIITFDGLRWQEVFSGAEEGLVGNATYVADPEALKTAYWRDTPEERRETLLPFLWSYVPQNGYFLGNRNKGSRMSVSNTKNYSYPGYSEMFCGYADDERVDSNDPVVNPNTNVLEVAARNFRLKQLGYNAAEELAQRIDANIDAGIEF